MAFQQISECADLPEMVEGEIGGQDKGMEGHSGGCEVGIGENGWVNEFFDCYAGILTKM
jgi:hypothetical protein